MANNGPQSIEDIINGLVIRIARLEGSVRGGVQQGLAANRPTAPTVASIYYATNTKVLSVWNSATDSWNTVSLS